MATGHYDADGFWIYGEDDLADEGQGFSEVLNKSARAIPDAVHTLVVDELTSDPTIRAAATDAIDDEVASRDLVEGGTIVEVDLSFAIVDEDNRRTWLEADLAGRPTPRAAHLIATTAGPEIAATVGLEDQDDEVTGVAFAVTDEDGRRTELEVGTDGKLTNRVIQSIGTRLFGSSEVPMESGPDILCSGDSLTAGSAMSFPLRLAQLMPGRNVINHGQGGDGSDRIAQRQGGFPKLIRPIGGTIPSSGPVEVTVESSGMWGSGSLGLAASHQGMLAGVHGTLAEDEATNPFTYTFTRSTPGDPVEFDASPQPFYTDTALAHRHSIQVFWAGNNYPETAPDADAVLADIAAMVEWMQAADKRFIVLGLITNDGTAQGSPRWNVVMEINKRLQEIYGRKFLDIRHYLREYALADAGITPTAQDIAAYEFGTVPHSLRVDTIHFNNTGYQLIGDQVYQRMTEMGWV